MKLSQYEGALGPGPEFRPPALLATEPVLPPAHNLVSPDSTIWLPAFRKRRPKDMVGGVMARRKSDQSSLVLNEKHLMDPAPMFRKLLRDPEVHMYYREEMAKIEIAAALRAVRQRAKLTQAALAKRAGTTQGVVARMESGTDDRVLVMPLLARLAEACGARFEFGFSFKKVGRV